MSDTEHFATFDHEKMAEAARRMHPGMDRRTLRTRQALHQALFRLVLERGYDQTSVADIADTANVGRSTFYAHFTDKDDLLAYGIGYLRTMKPVPFSAVRTWSGYASSRVNGRSPQASV